MRLLAVLAAVAAAVVLGAGAAGGAATSVWPQFHFSVAHRGVNPDEHTLKRSNVGRLHVLWTAKVSHVDGGIVNSSVAVGPELVFVGNGDNRLYAFERRTGRRRWFAETGSDIQSSPTVVGGTVYVGSDDGYLYAFRTSNGVQLWRTDVGQATESSSPEVVDGTLYIGSSIDNQQRGELFAINARTGAVRWQAQLSSPPGASSPTVAGGKVYVGNSDGNVLAYPTRCATPCKPSWKYELRPGLEVGTAAFADGKLFVSGDAQGGSWVFALRARCRTSVCRPIWTGRTVRAYTFSTPAVAGGRVFAQGQGLFAFPEACSRTCRPLWRGNAIGGSSPAVANGVVYAGSTIGGRLYAFAVNCARRGRTCRPLFRGPPTGGQPYATSPAVVGGRVYYAAYSRVRAFGLRRR